MTRECTLRNHDHPSFAGRAPGLTHIVTPTSAGQPAAALGLSHPSGARAALYPDGAQLFTWWPSQGSEVLFVSERSKRRVGGNVRGGVPIIFPQFAQEGTLPRHGFARTLRWEPMPRDTMTVLAMRLEDSEATRTVWPHRFDAEYTVTLDDRSVTMQFAVTNRGVEPFEFTCALHTYLRVGDVERVAVDGLHGCRYRDALDGNAEHVDDSPRLRLDGGVNRVYFDTPPVVTLEDPALGRTIAVEADGFADTVVWNPGAEGEQAFDDMATDDHKHFLCIESARIGTPVSLAPAARWVGRQILRL